MTRGSPFAGAFLSEQPADRITSSKAHVIPDEAANISLSSTVIPTCVGLERVRIEQGFSFHVGRGSHSEQAQRGRRDVDESRVLVVNRVVAEQGPGYEAGIDAMTTARPNVVTSFLVR